MWNKLLYSQFPWSSYAERLSKQRTNCQESIQTTHTTHLIFNGNNHHLSTENLDFPLPGEGGREVVGRFLIAVFCVYDYRETAFSFTALWPIFGHYPLPLPNFQTSSTPNLQPGGPHTTCRTDTVWYLAQNLSSMGDPTGSYTAASTAFRSPLRYASSFTVLNVNIICLHTLHRQPLGSN